MHSHATAFAFIDWCSEEFAPGPDDVFSSHAPFHFDLSIFDLYVSVKHGAPVVLIASEASRQPAALLKLVEERKITVWYSTPSILRLMLEHPEFESADCRSLRAVVFAGEVFPIKHLQSLSRRWTWPRYYNLYGPTETNVCTYYRCDAAEIARRAAPVPIGRVCSDDSAAVVDADGRACAGNAEGELVIAGGSVMLGYWNLPERSADAFLVADGERYYRTGDIVRTDEQGEYVYIGRRDRMIKRRGYRVELGEIEAALNRHPELSEAAVIARADESGDIAVIAFCAPVPGGKVSTIKLKQFCAQYIPVYMQPDRFVQLDALPKTSTDKTDYQRLKDMA